MRLLSVFPRAFGSFIGRERGGRRAKLSPRACDAAFSGHPADVVFVCGAVGCPFLMALQLPTSWRSQAPLGRNRAGIRRVARGPGLRGRAWTSRVWREHGPGRRVEALALNRIGLPRYVRTHRGKSPGLLTKEWGRNFPASFVGPPTAAKIRPVSCGRAALPHVRSRGSEAVTPPCAWK